MDPVRRAKHDAWILAQEKAAKVETRSAAAAVASAASASHSGTTARPVPPRPSATRKAAQPPRAASSVKAAKGLGPVQTIKEILAVLFLFGLFILALGKLSSRPNSGPIEPLVPTYQPETPAIPYPQQKATVAPPAVVSPSAAAVSRVPRPAPTNTWTPPTYSRKATAPNGQPWPARTAYVPGYPVLKTGGLSTLTIDNSRNNEDVFLKVFSLKGGEQSPVRYALIKAGTLFEFANIAPGHFDVRYQNLDTGKISRSEPFELEEVQEYNGTRYSQIRLTLYKVLNGNTRTHEISENEF